MHRFPGALSLNAAISGSVMLASRLPSTLHVFGLMLLAIEWFALFPMFRRYLHVCAVPCRAVPCRAFN